MQFGKRIFFVALNGLVSLVLLVYFLFWLFCSTVKGTIQPPLEANIIVVSYTVNNKLYTESFMRSGIPFQQRQVELRCWGPRPTVARVNSFMGFVAEPLAWWFVFLLASAMLLLTNNTVFSKGTRFQLHKGFPWITMDEYFPAPTRQQEGTRERRQRGAPVKKLQDKR